jgi:hypothetical protein
MIECQTGHPTGEKGSRIDQMCPKVQDLGEIELGIGYNVLGVLVMPGGTSVDNAYT